VEGKKTKGRPRQMMLDWMLVDSYRNFYSCPRVRVYPQTSTWYLFMDCDT